MNTPTYRDGVTPDEKFDARPCTGGKPGCPNLVRASRDVPCIPCMDDRATGKGGPKPHFACDLCGKPTTGKRCRDCYVTHGGNNSGPRATEKKCSRDTASKICALLLEDAGVGDVYYSQRHPSQNIGLEAHGG